MPSKHGAPEATPIHRVLTDTVGPLRALFRDVPANLPMLEAFFSGRTPGCAFVDAPTRPSVCVVAVNFRFVFFGGLLTPGFLGASIQRLRREQALQVMWPSAVRTPRGDPSPDDVRKRVEYWLREDPLGARLRECRETASGLKARRITGTMLGRCRWVDEVEQAVGSRSEFLSHGLGYCLVDRSEVVAEAYGMIWSADRVEIATVTHPDHRGRGLASAVCAHLIGACESMGLSAYWNCDADNEASHRVAAKLGFCRPSKYRILDYDRFPNPLSG